MTILTQLRQLTAQMRRAQAEGKLGTEAFKNWQWRWRQISQKHDAFLYCFNPDTPALQVTGKHHLIEGVILLNKGDTLQLEITSHMPVIHVRKTPAPEGLTPCSVEVTFQNGQKATIWTWYDLSAYDTEELAHSPYGHLTYFELHSRSQTTRSHVLRNCWPEIRSSCFTCKRPIAKTPLPTQCTECQAKAKVLSRSA